ncbi:class I SAM-dependent methyltransferase [Azospirillum sp. B4]|uniref:class I SAM-dependent methyltransferase n=1 Tax=Azospirillum sp. B4 TaxID=95605 RepID=UPI000678E90C|nr:class I SAM-dependent methyltransferase [Azospirillum sp. B4]
MATNTVPDIDSLLVPTHDEFARQRAVAAIHTHAMLRLRFDCRTAYERNVKPAFEREHGRAPETGAEIAEAIKGDPFYQFYSSIRYNAQEMGPLARQPAVERALPAMIEIAKSAAQSNAAGGSLRLDPDLVVPDYMTEYDVHLAAGSYHSEFVDDDVAQGVLLGRGLSPIAGKGRITKNRNFAGVGQSIAHWLKAKYPAFAPRRMLDMATQSGANLTAYPKAFPGLEAHGIDVAAPGLRYGHAKAEFEDVAIHFSQQDAAHTDFPDGHFDLVVSSFFLHEVPVPVTHQILKEAYRLLAPGGLLVFMELPPHKACDAFMNFAYDWDTEHNNEPFYRDYRSQDPTELVVAAGFPRDSALELTIPDITSFDMDRYPAFLKGEIEAPPHGRGGWFIFGARKPG